jgi:hypothetical protein
MLDAMLRSQFAILLIDQQHDAAGLIATDILRNSNVWLMDVGLESSLDDGQLIATRLLSPGPFSMIPPVSTFCSRSRCLNGFAGCCRSASAIAS